MTIEMVKFKIQRKSFRITSSDQVIVTWIDTNYFHGPLSRNDVTALVDRIKINEPNQTYRVMRVVTTEEEIYQC